MFRTAPDADLRHESFERAHALFQLDEHEAALKTLKKIIATEPIDDLTIDAVVLATDIYLAEGNDEQASLAIRQLERRLPKTSKLDLKRLNQAKFRLRRTLPATDASAHVMPAKAGVQSGNTDVELDANLGWHDKEAKETPPEESPPAAIPLPTSNLGHNIGILLPLSGPYAPYGERILAAIKIALNSEHEQKADGVITLKNADGVASYVLDTAGKAAVAGKGVDRLVEEFHVGIVVGDILNDTAQAVAKKCQEHGVINIALSRKDALTMSNDSVYQVASTSKKQLEALVKFSQKTADYRRFAILYPENNFGREMRDAFLSVAREQNLQIVKQVGYKPDETTFTSSVRGLVGPKNTSGNLAFERCNERANRIKDVPARKKAERDCLDAVVPSVPFDALFIPEFPKALTYIVPALVSEGILVSQNEDVIQSYRRTSRLNDVSPVQLLGTSSWNNEALGEKLGKQLDGAIFVDSADLKESREVVKRFVDRFQAATQTVPTPHEALAYDAASIVEKVLNSSPAGLGSITSSLRNLDEEGVVGRMSFDQNRELDVPFRWFSFRDGKIEPRT